MPNEQICLSKVRSCVRILAPYLDKLKKGANMSVSVRKLLATDQAHSGAESTSIVNPRVLLQLKLARREMCSEISLLF